MSRKFPAQPLVSANDPSFSLQIAAAEHAAPDATHTQGGPVAGQMAALGRDLTRMVAIH
ncbi:MAG: hypothetical protein M9947_14155 [Thermomicrobiales bacterium]|nr:hypothetical protein [Thermomicrobiales bacterium]